MGIKSWFNKLYGIKNFAGPIMSVLILMSIVSMAYSQSAVNAICSVYNVVHSIIFILGLTLIILGGAVYAGAHLLPGQTKGTAQGYAMGMLIGGVIGVAIAMAAGPILQAISGQTNIAATCNGITAI
ncbi:MAG: hypothetical protein QXW10_02780 [Candidatus Micrarchaeaceae archaeon]